MKNYKTLEGFSYRGQGFMLFKDTSNPRLSNSEVARKIGAAMPKHVTHICRNPYEGYTAHVLQYTHLYEKDKRK